MKKILLVAALFLTFTCFAADNRADNNFGLYVGVYDPIPGSAGLNLGWNITSFLRVSGGFSSYTNAEGGFFEDMSESIISGLFYIILLGLADYDDVREFFDTEDESVHKYVFSYAGGLNFFVPGWNLSPTVGVQVGSYSSKNNPFGLRNSESYVCYRTGLEWQTKVGLMLGVGYSYTPVLPAGLRNKYYAQLGWFF